MLEIQTTNHLSKNVLCIVLEYIKFKNLASFFISHDLNLDMKFKYNIFESMRV